MADPKQGDQAGWAVDGEPGPAQFTDLTSVFERPVSAVDVYHLLERFAYLEAWNAVDLSPAGKPQPVDPKDIPGASPLYAVSNRGSCVSATPKSLFSDHTLRDSFDTATALFHYVHQNKKWNKVQLSGLHAMARVFWVAAQLRAVQFPKEEPMDIVHYKPSVQDYDIVRKILAMGGPAKSSPTAAPAA